MTLRIRNLADPTISTPLVPDVRHQHPEWVHEQLGTEDEGGLQLFLGNIHEEEYLELGPDEVGIYSDGGLV